MNSLMARNSALVLIIYLLWHVLNGIYTNQPALTTQKSISPQYINKSIANEKPDNIKSASALKKIETRSLTADEIHQIMITGRLPEWAKKPGDRKLNLEEIENIVTTGKLPDM